MKNPEMKVVRFASEDVIATSLAVGHYFTTGKEWAQYEGSGLASNGSVEFDWDGATITKDKTNWENYSGNGYYAWYNNADGTWGTDYLDASHYGMWESSFPKGND